jgi:hypothetical protein
LSPSLAVPAYCLRFAFAFTIDVEAEQAVFGPPKKMPFSIKLNGISYFACWKTSSEADIQSM